MGNSLERPDPAAVAEKGYVAWSQYTKKMAPYLDGQAKKYRDLAAYAVEKLPVHPAVVQRFNELAHKYSSAARVAEKLWPQARMGKPEPFTRFVEPRRGSRQVEMTADHQQAAIDDATSRD